MGALGATQGACPHPASENQASLGRWPLASFIQAGQEEATLSGPLLSLPADGASCEGVARMVQPLWKPVWCFLSTAGNPSVRRRVTAKPDEIHLYDGLLFGPQAEGDSDTLQHGGASAASH